MTANRNKILKKALKSLSKALPYTQAIESAATILDRLKTVKGLYLSAGEQFHSLSQTLFHNHEALQDDSFSWHQALLPHQRFSIPLALSPQDQEEDTSSATSFNALFSGSFEFSRFHDKDNALDFDSSSSYLLGLDVVPNPDVPLVTGLRFALTNSHTDFDDGDLTTEGSYDLQLFTLHPYVSWEATDSLSLWASLGYGWGTTDLTIGSIDDPRFVFVADSSDTTSEDTFFSVAASSSLQLWRADTTASFLDTHLQQAASPHNSHTTPHCEAGLLSSSLDLALLTSATDASATELTGALNWLPTNNPISAPTSTRILLFDHERQEWGIGGSVLLRPGQ